MNAPTAYILIMSALAVAHDGSPKMAISAPGVFESKAACEKIIQDIRIVASQNAAKQAINQGFAPLGAQFACAPMPSYYPDNKVFEETRK